MLSANSIHKINNQIQDELRTVSRCFSSHEEKMEALERIAELKKLLTPQPTREEIREEIASVLQDALKTSSTHTPRPTSLADVIMSFANRR